MCVTKVGESWPRMTISEKMCLKAIVNWSRTLAARSETLRFGDFYNYLIIKVIIKVQN